MRELWRVPLDGDAQARVGFTTRTDGDLAVTLAPDELDARRRGLIDRPWVWLRQVHGSDVALLDVEDDVASVCGTEADAVVTRRSDVALSVNVADCAPVALVGSGGVVGAVHAGWRGLSLGVIQAAVEVMRAAGAGTISAYLGPCIHPECYAFGTDELALLVDRYGPAVASETSRGEPALDMPAAVAVALGEADVALADGAGLCTACAGAEFFSHRRRGDVGRHALAVWIASGDDGQ